MNARRKLPPYGKALLDARYRGLAPRDLFVCMDDWRAEDIHIRELIERTGGERRAA